MGKIFTLIWGFLKEKNRWAIALVIVLLLSAGTIIKLQRNKIDEWKGKYQTEAKLKDALIDSVSYYRNQRDEVVAEKLTLQESIKNLEKMYGQLSDNQKELLTRIKEINKKNSVISAALIETNVKIDSLLAKDGKDGGQVVIDTTKKMVNFNNVASKDSTFRYNIDVNNILPAYPDIKPTMLFKSLEFPNKQFIEFHWRNDKKKGYPVAFSTSNSNQYFKTINIDSYAIPPLDKVKLNPTGWQKVGNFFIKNGRTLVYVGVGAAAGAGGVYLLTK